jgi:hypothetical protein
MGSGPRLRNGGKRRPGGSELVQCTNEYIRAKRRFDTDYAAGKL